MRLLPREYTIASEKNGIVRVREFLWWVSVYAGGFEQSGPYVHGLWRHALAHVRNIDVKRVLIVGVCAGDNIRLVQRRFPRAEVIAVEWDSALIALAKKLHRFTPVEIIHGDMREVLPTLVGPFDLILSDAFYGDMPDVGANDTRVGGALARLLSPSGLYILNASRTLAAIEYISHFLRQKASWHYRDNTVALFENTR